MNHHPTNRQTRCLEPLRDLICHPVRFAHRQSAIDPNLDINEQTQTAPADPALINPSGSGLSTPQFGWKTKRVTDATEVLGTVELPQGKCEVCASADGKYDDVATRLEVKMDAFLRTTDLLTKERRFPAEWLPKPETVREIVGPDETVEMA